MIGDLEKGWQIVRQRDFSGGENLSDLPDMIAVNQFAKAENVMLSPEGWLTDVFQMDKNALYSATALSLTGMVLDQMPSTNQFNYFHTSGGLVDNVYHGSYDPAGAAIDMDGGTYTYCADANITGLSKAVDYLGKKYCINGGGGVLNLSDFVVIKDGNLITMPLVKLTTYGNRLWGVTTTGELIFSDNGDATKWDYLNIIKLSAWEKAIDFLPVQGGVIVYSRSSAYAMYGTDYTDITLVPLIRGVMLSDGAVELNNTVYVLGNRGVYRITLNGLEEIPNTQNRFFKANYLAWTANETGNVQGIYLYKYHAILYLFRSDVGTQGFIYYLAHGAFYKVNHSLPVAAPYMLALENGDLDFLIYSDGSHICKGTAPTGTLAANRTATIKTAHLDMGSPRSKVLREFAIVSDAAVNSTVTINAYLDGSATPAQVFHGLLVFEPAVVVSGVTIPSVLTRGDNRVWLSLPRFNTIALEIIFESGIIQTAGFSIRELRLKFRVAGPAA